MSRLRDQDYLRNEQYRDGGNLSARISLHERFSVNQYGWQRWLFEQMAMPAQARVLDVGCGTAALWRGNLDRIDSSWAVTLTDLSEGMVEAARSQLGADAGRFSWGVVDAQAMPFDDASFDVVIANHMLYHVPDRERALGELRRVLRAGGALYAATNGQAHIRELDELLLTVAPDAERDDGAEVFGLESAPEQLMRHFGAVTLRYYPDALEVTESEAIVRYLLSGAAGEALSGEQIERMLGLVEAEIAAKGSFHVTKSSGVFEGRV